MTGQNFSTLDFFTAQHICFALYDMGCADDEGRLRNRIFSAFDLALCVAKRVAGEIYWSHQKMMLHNTQNENFF